MPPFGRQASHIPRHHAGLMTSSGENARNPDDGKMQIGDLRGEREPSKESSNSHPGRMGFQVPPGFPNMNHPPGGLSGPPPIHRPSIGHFAMSEPPIHSMPRQRPGLHRPGPAQGPQRTQNARHGYSGYIGGFGTGEDGGPGFRAFDKKQHMSTKPGRAEPQEDEHNKQKVDQEEVNHKDSLKRPETKQGKDSIGKENEARKEGQASDVKQ